MVTSPVIKIKDIYDAVAEDSSESSEDEIGKMTSKGLGMRVNSQCFQAEMASLNGEEERPCSQSENSDDDRDIYTGGYSIGKEDGE